MHLTKAEEQVMKYLWRIEKGFIRDIINEYPDPKPATTTVITLLKRMIDKGFVQFRQYGINREYFPIVKRITSMIHLSNLLHFLLQKLT